MQYPLLAQSGRCPNSGHPNYGVIQGDISIRGAGNADRALFCFMVGVLVKRSDNRSSAVRFKRVSACIPLSSGQLRGRRSPRCLANGTL
jgi:hypothetical protein